MEFELSNILTEPLIKQALQEDLGRSGDITTLSTIKKGTLGTVLMNTRADGCLAGIDIAKQVFEMVDHNLTINIQKQDGDLIKKGEILMTISGEMRSILTAERVALNFISHMSGIATITNKMSIEIGDNKAKIAATRKTTPNMRIFEKYAVCVGGGTSHRMGLDDMILIKDNHIAASGSITNAIKNAREYIGHTVKIEIEVDNFEQLNEVLKTDIDIIMLDNFSNSDTKKAVEIINGKAIIESSGTVTLDRVKGIADTGVDIISVGYITHSTEVLDIGLDYQP